jgi:hypothetical protein
MYALKGLRGYHGLKSFGNAACHAFRVGLRVLHLKTNAMNGNG